MYKILFCFIVVASCSSISAGGTNAFSDTGHSPQPETFGLPALRSIGQLYDPALGRTSCTATLIAPDVIVTAAHCLFKDGKPNQIRFQFITGDAHINKGKRVSILVDSEIEFSLFIGNPSKDIAFIRLAKQLDLTKYPPAKTDSMLSTKTTGEFHHLQLTGYYHIADVEQPTTEACRFINYYEGKNYFTHNCSTTAGMSGSPLYIMRNGSLTILGIHKGSPSDCGEAPVLFSTSCVNWAADAGGITAALAAYQTGHFKTEDPLTPEP